MKGDEGKKEDSFMEEYYSRKNGWHREGRIPFSAKVIPVNESIEAKQWVLPTEQVLKMLRNAHSIRVQKCICRSHYKRCDNPLEVCLVLNDSEGPSGEKEGRYITFKEAKEIVRQANERGLVHCTIYNPDQYPYAICSCCSCCCHELHILTSYGRPDLVVHSEYITGTDMNSCNHCGICVERCLFGAREMEDGKMKFDRERCYGCGLCVTVCPTEANALGRRGKNENE